MDVLDHPLFAHCDHDALRPLLQSLRASRVRRGSLLVAKPQGPANLYLILQGALMAFGWSAGGRRVIFELSGPGEIDGILAADGRSGHLTQAAVDSLVLPISRDDLGRLIGADATVAVNLTSLLLTRQEKREAQIEALSESTTVHRLARQLLALARFLGKPEANDVVRVPRLTHQVLADMVGLRRETVTTKLDQLVSAGAVAIEGRQLRLSPEALRSLLRDRPNDGGIA